MTNIEFIENLYKALANPNVYGTGAFGAPTGYKNNTERYYENTLKTKGKTVAEKIKNAPAGTFIWDCIGLGRGCGGWGWNADKNARYGGSVYCNGFPDFTIKSLHKYCDWTESKCLDPNEIEPGEWLRTANNDHVAYYVGDGKIINATSRVYGICEDLLGSWEWNGHGKFNYIDYIPREQYFKIGMLVCPHCGSPIQLLSK